MERVTGVHIDPTTSTIGIVTRRTDQTCILNASTITSRGRRGDGAPELTNRLVKLAAEIDYAIGAAALVVVDTPPDVVEGNGSPRKQLWCFVVGRLRKRRVPVATRTRLGPAEDVTATVTALWPAVVLSSAEEATAAELAHLGAVRAGWNVPVHPAHFTALDRVRWPESSPVPA